MEELFGGSGGDEGGKDDVRNFSRNDDGVGQTFSSRRSYVTYVLTVKVKVKVKGQGGQGSELGLLVLVLVLV